MPMRAAPHTHRVRPPLLPLLPPSLRPRHVNVTRVLACEQYTHIRTFTRIRYLATVRPLEKQFDLAAQVRWIQPPSSISLSLLFISPDLLKRQISWCWIRLRDVCPLSRLSEMRNCGIMANASVSRILATTFDTWLNHKIVKEYFQSRYYFLILINNSFVYLFTQCILRI